MDENKLEKLREIGYQLKPTCRTCVHSEILLSQKFGVCGLHTYKHLKHSEEVSQLSISEYGSCDQYERRDIPILEPWSEFFNA